MGSCMPGMIFLGDVLTKSGYKLLAYRDGEVVEIPEDKVRGYYIHSHGMMHNRLYRNLYIVTDSGKIVEAPLKCILEEAIEVRDVCELMQIVKPAEIGGATIYPIITVYSNALYEHLSTTPLQILSRVTTYLYHKVYGLGIVYIDEEPDMHRPIMSKVIVAPTTEILAKRCGVVSLPTSQVVKQEVDVPF